MTLGSQWRAFLEVAERDTGQSRRVANFLLGWWNANTCGGFDILDGELQVGIMQVLGYIVAHQGHYPDRLVAKKWMERLDREWRPKLLQDSAICQHGNEVDQAPG